MSKLILLLCVLAGFLGFVAGCSQPEKPASCCSEQCNCICCQTPGHECPPGAACCPADKECLKGCDCKAKCACKGAAE